MEYIRISEILEVHEITFDNTCIPISFFFLDIPYFDIATNDLRNVQNLYHFSFSDEKENSSNLRTTRAAILYDVKEGDIPFPGNPENPISQHPQCFYSTSAARPGTYGMRS